jgi:hypothetical protein
MQAEGGTAESGAESTGPDPARCCAAVRRRFRLRLIMRRAQMPDLPRPPLREVHDLHRRRARRRPHRPHIRHQATSGPLISAHTQAPRTTKPQLSEPQASWAANPVTSQGQHPSGLPSHRAFSGMRVNRMVADRDGAGAADRSGRRLGRRRGSAGVRQYYMRNSSRVWRVSCTWT